MINAHRVITSSVWKGLKLVPSNLCVQASSSNDHEHDDVKRRPLNLELRSAPFYVNPITYTNIGLPTNGFVYNHSDKNSICAIYEGSHNAATTYSNTNRLDVFPVKINFDASSLNNNNDNTNFDATASRKLNRKVNTSEAAVQTELVNKDLTSKGWQNDVNDMINQFKGFVDNELGLEMAAEHLGKEALESWIKAANIGCADAMYNIALCYSNGTFVKKNLSNAILLWKRASKLGHALSLYQLAVCYIRGIGTEKDREYGISLMKQSADMGCSRAEYFMAIKLLRDGERSSSIEYLENAIKHQQFRSLIERWLNNKSLPHDIRNIVSNSLDKYNSKHQI